MHETPATTGSGEVLDVCSLTLGQPYHCTRAAWAIRLLNNLRKMLKTMSLMFKKCIGVREKCIKVCESVLKCIIKKKVLKSVIFLIFSQLVDTAYQIVNRRTHNLINLRVWPFKGIKQKNKTAWEQKHKPSSKMIVTPSCSIMTSSLCYIKYRADHSSPKYLN